MKINTLLLWALMLPWTANSQTLGLTPMTNLESLPSSTYTPLNYASTPSLIVGVGGTQTELQAQVGVNFIKSHYLEAFSALDFKRDENLEVSTFSALAGFTMLYPFADLLAPSVVIGAGIQQSDYYRLEYDKELEEKKTKEQYTAPIFQTGPELRFLLAKNFYLSMQKIFVWGERPENKDGPSIRETIRFNMIF